MKPDAIFKGSSFGKREESRDGEIGREKKQKGKRDKGENGVWK